MLLLVALLKEAFPLAWSASRTWSGQAAIGALFLLCLVLTYLVYRRYKGVVEGSERLQAELSKAERLVGEAYQRLDAIFRVSQRFVEASDENEVVEPILRLLVDLTGADGAAFIPLDEHGQPQTALSHGELPVEAKDAWVEYLASPRVRERCEACELKDKPGRPADCPLLEGPFTDVVELLCLPVRRGEREFGVASIFLSDGERLDERTLVFLRAVIDETALGLEGVQLRRRELAALRQIQVLRQKTDLSALLRDLLENVHRTLEADFAMMVVPKTDAYQSKIDLALGDFLSQARPFVDGILQDVMASGKPVLLGDVAGDPVSTPGLRSLMAAPLISSERLVVGAISVGTRRVRGFHHRQLALLQTVAGQVALVVQNASLMAELEYQTMIQERTRLAREIHDGLAQTIGFLKLQAAQLRNDLARGEIERARRNVDLFYATLSETYQDARHAIDGLRVSPVECEPMGWLEQMAAEFQEISGLQVDLYESEVRIHLPPEIHAQLIRIFQEALSNVRKHARASQVWIACREVGDDILLEVRDNGKGFSPEDVTTSSQHGLRGIHERAELIGADFQVVSRPKEGTIVQVRLPYRGSEE